MKHVSLNIDNLVNKVDMNEIRLPEIQRGYVWKPTQVAGLIDSLYRGYPSGSLLLWETEGPVDERDAQIAGPNAEPMVKPQYLLDGQQRLTSLHRVLKGHDEARVVFNVESEKFQIESSITKKDPRWLAVHDVLNGNEGIFALVTRLHEKLPEVSTDELSRRIERVKKISDYAYHIEIIEGLEYEEVTDIFVRVNSKGRALKAVDLALATLSARWPGVVKKLENERDHWKKAGYRHIDFSFLTRSLAAIANDSATLKGFTSTSTEQLELGWDRTRKGLEHCVSLLKNNAGIVTSDLIPSMNAVVPLVTYLGYRDDQPMSPDESNALIYWLLGAFLLQRFSSGVDTVIAQDAAAIRGGGGVEGLYRNLGIHGVRLSVGPEQLIGRGAGSSYFLLSYLAARQAKAKDWWYGTEMALGGQGGFSIEYHHIHPRATLRKEYSKAEINDLSNLAFISAKANRKISDRSPAVYFPELLKVDAEALAGHLVPMQENLRTADRFADFLESHRALLAQGITEVLDAYRPESIGATAPTATDPTSGESLIISVFTETHDPLDGVVVFEVVQGGSTWRATVPAGDMDRALNDLDEGLASEIEIAGTRIAFEPEADLIEVPLGPLMIEGTLEEWRKVWIREQDEATITDSLPSVSDSPAWDGTRTPFSILASE